MPTLRWLFQLNEPQLVFSCIRKLFQGTAPGRCPRWNVWSHAAAPARPPTFKDLGHACCQGTSEQVQSQEQSVPDTEGSDGEDSRDVAPGCGDRTTSLRKMSPDKSAADKSHTAEDVGEGDSDQEKQESKSEWNQRTKWHRTERPRLKSQAFCSVIGLDRKVDQTACFPGDACSVVLLTASGQKSPCQDAGRQGSAAAAQGDASLHLSFCLCPGQTPPCSRPLLLFSPYWGPTAHGPWWQVLITQVM